MARLKAALSRGRFSLAVLYGRRRLGKSTLVKRVLTDADIYFLADRSEGAYQRVLLAKVVAQQFPDFDKVAYPVWESIFGVPTSGDNSGTTFGPLQQFEYNPVGEYLLSWCARPFRLSLPLYWLLCCEWLSL